METDPGTTAIGPPPLYDEKPFDATIRAGHGKYIFSTENVRFGGRCWSFVHRGPCRLPALPLINKLESLYPLGASR